MALFNAYDIRGIYPTTLNLDIVYKIGFFLPQLLKTDKVLIAHDARLSSPDIYSALTNGITDAGASVYSMGLSTTPMVYYATAKYEFLASVQVSASHNPKQYNGLKISTKNAQPVGYDNGLNQLEKLVYNEKIVKADKKGEVIGFDIKKEYIEFLLRYKCDLSSLSIAIDCSNAVGALVIKHLLEGEGVDYINDVIDGNFPAHEPNPLEIENVADLIKMVKENKNDIGVIFDGDADRVMFVDENGEFVSPDLITILLACYYNDKLGTLEGQTVIYDIRSSKSVYDYIKNCEAKPYMWKVGHAFAKRKMAELDAIVGGELAGHYYFRDFFYCDSGMLSALMVLDIVAMAKNNNQKFSEIIKGISHYVYSGEINFVTEKKDEAMQNIATYFESKYTIKNKYDFDGIRLEFDDFWICVRKSNTEPYLRLVAEAVNKDVLQIVVDKASDIIKATY